MTVAARAVTYIVRGDDVAIPITVVTQQPGVDPPYTGLGTSDITATLKHRDTGVTIWTGTKAGGQIVVTNNAAGEMTVTIPRATTAALELRPYNLTVTPTASAGVGARETVSRLIVWVLDG